MVEDDGGAWHIVAKSFQGFVEERQPMLGTGIPPPFGNRLVKRVVVAGRSEKNAVRRTEPGNVGLGQEDLTCWNQPKRVGPFGFIVYGPLVHWIEQSDPVQFITEEIEPVGEPGTGREYIDNATADGELTRFHHGLDSLVAGLPQEPGKLIDVEGIADRQLTCAALVGAAWRNALQKGRDCR